MDYFNRHLGRKLVNATVGFTVFVMAYFFLQLVWWQAYPYQTADIVVPMEVTNENNEVAVGEKLKLHLLIDKQSDYNPTITRNIVCADRSVHFVAPVNNGGGVTRPQGEFTADVEMIIPDSVPRDTECEFQYINAYEVNPVRTITKKWCSELFTVKGE